jgi:hypothetical protein
MHMWGNVTAVVEEDAREAEAAATAAAGGGATNGGDAAHAGGAAPAPATNGHSSAWGVFGGAGGVGAQWTNLGDTAAGR